MYKIYQIEYGDTLDKIADKSGTTVDNIKQINGLRLDSDLIVGNLIIVPKMEDRIFEKYIVKKGDSIYSIARMFNVEPSVLYALNGLDKDDYIYPNQELIVPNRDVIMYITKPGDTIDSVINNLGIDANTLNNENSRLYLVEEQLVVHKKEANN